MENHHHQHRHESEPKALSASLRAFRSNVSNCVNQVLLNSKPGSDFLSLLWIQKCFELLSNLNRAFAKLVVEIDYPMTKWDDSAVEDYLKYSLKLLDLLNLISSSLSHLGKARVKLSHALSLVDSSPQSAIKRLKAVEFKTLNKDLKVEEIEESEEKMPCSRKDLVRQALVIMNSICFWVCGVVLSVLSGDIRPCLEMRKLTQRRIHCPSLVALDSRFHEAVKEKRWVVKEVRELNDDVARLAAAIAAGESSGTGKKLERELEAMQKMVDGIGKEGDDLFAGLLAGRSKLLDGLRADFFSKV
ncbi:protein BPS1, chloroplastic-like [Actinidia eriantha]|uniref:protein BPS1, chloroplastic-like n=1 Tax=Actinidia eriantha TaxID=165200 RepID=UPI00258B133D|nr:protein BPS1, chloroplastic-like [Actinidia eriantha]